MKRILLLGFALWLVANIAYAQGEGGWIVIYSDSLLTDCTFHSQPGYHTFYIVHEYPPSATSSRFRIVHDPGFNGNYIGEWSPYAVEGNIRDGILVNYGSCVSSRGLVATITYLFISQPGTCSYLQAVPDPDASSGTIEVTNCEGELYEALGLEMYANPAEMCPWWCVPGIAVEKSTWGRIKALYEDGL
jgi:hypothetical protein